MRQQQEAPRLKPGLQPRRPAVTPPRPIAPPMPPRHWHASRPQLPTRPGTRPTQLLTTRIRPQTPLNRRQNTPVRQLIRAVEAGKQATAAKTAANAATKAVETAQKTYNIAREAEAEDLNTHTNAGVEVAMTQKAAGDTFTVDVSRSVIEGQAIVDETKALTAKANKSDTDEASLAVKGRAVALRALRYFGSWRQDAAAQALSGTDSDVAEYLRTGWDKAVADETRQQVADLASDSPYETVRTAADATLDGTDTEILDFYTTGQHQAADADYRVAVTKLANDGGPGVKDDAKKALADGSTNALVDFLNKGRYASQQADERVTATQLYNDGGPEVRSAAKIALAGPADEVHQFVEAYQYIAAQKDRLDDTHLAQMQRLIAEGQGIAATARKNSAVAAQAAAVAGNAAFDAAQSKLDAERSAKDAEGYAAAADTAADHAETSAKQAKASATTARAASDRAAQDSAAAA